MLKCDDDEAHDLLVDVELRGKLAHRRWTPVGKSRADVANESPDG